MHPKSILLIFFLLFAMIPASFLKVRANPGIIYVPDNYPTIQQAVYKAALGDTIIVRQGRTYYENVIVNQTVSLVGENSATTIIDGQGIDDVLTLNNTTVSISGFTIRNGMMFSGILTSQFGNHKIFDNILKNNAYGINLQLSSGNTVVNNMLIDNSPVGINLPSSSNNNVTKNYVSQSAFGIKIEGGSGNNFIINNILSDTSYGVYMYSSNLNDVDKNTISSKTIGIYSIYSSNGDIRDNIVSGCAYGIELYGGSTNNILRNTAVSNSYGLYLVLTTGNLIDSNLASNNDWGSYFYDADTNTFTFNTASYNTYGIYLTSTSTGNSIYKNNLLQNTMQAFQAGSSTNTWYIKISGKNYGNYWSDFLGEDTNGDGVGDSPPDILPYWSVDNYPLMNPTMTIHDVAIISVEPSATSVEAGQVVNITVIARNEGTVNETSVTVTAKYLNRIIGTQTVNNLARYTSTTLLFNWDTTNVPTGFNYPISAEASPIVGETDKLDNTKTDGTVEVKEKFIGDINGDGTVNLTDLLLLNQAFGSVNGGSNWNPNADLNQDNIIEAVDLYLLGKNYGKKT